MLPMNRLGFVHDNPLSFLLVVEERSAEGYAIQSIVCKSLVSDLCCLLPNKKYANGGLLCFVVLQEEASKPSAPSHSKSARNRRQKNRSRARKGPKHHSRDLKGVEAAAEQQQEQEGEEEGEEEGTPNAAPGGGGAAGAVGAPTAAPAGGGRDGPQDRAEGSSPSWRLVGSADASQTSDVKQMPWSEVVVRRRRKQQQQQQPGQGHVQRGQQQQQHQQQVQVQGQGREQQQQQVQGRQQQQQVQGQGQGQQQQVQGQRQGQQQQQVQGQGQEQQQRKGWDLTQHTGPRPLAVAGAAWVAEEEVTGAQAAACAALEGMKAKLDNVGRRDHSAAVPAAKYRARAAAASAAKTPKVAAAAGAARTPKVAAAAEKAAEAAETAAAAANGTGGPLLPDIGSSSSSSSSLSWSEAAAAAPKPRKGKKVECVVCLDAWAQVMLLPCKHTILCQVCSSLLEAAGKPCPICCANVEQHLVTGRSSGNTSSRSSSRRNSSDGSSVPLVKQQQTLGSLGPQSATTTTILTTSSSRSSTSSSNATSRGTTGKDNSAAGKTMVESPQAQSSPVAIATTGDQYGPQGPAVSSNLRCSLSRGYSLDDWPLPLPACETSGNGVNTLVSIGVVNGESRYMAPAIAAAAATSVSALSQTAVNRDDAEPMGAYRQQLQQQQKPQQQEQQQQQQHHGSEVLRKQQEFDEKVSSLLAATRAEVLGLVDEALQRTMVQVKQLLQEYGVRELGEVEQLGMGAYLE